MKKLLLFLFITTPLFINAQSEAQTYIPDNNFEQALIDLGYDDVLDDFVLTENINTIKVLKLNNKGIIDFTGIRGFEMLEILETRNNTDISLDLRGNQYLKQLIAGRIIALDLSSNIDLEMLNVYGYSRTSEDIAFLDLTPNVKLKTISIGGTNINTLDLTNATQLEQLKLNSNAISEIDLSQNTNLQKLHLAKNRLSDLSLATNTLLKDIFIEEEPLSSVSLSQSLPIEKLTIRNTKISQLDLSTYSSLTNIDVNSNELENILLKKGDNQNISRLDITGNLKLLCIEVDDSDNIPSNWQKGLLTEYSINCTDMPEINPNATVMGFKVLDLGGLLINDYIARDLDDDGYYDRKTYFGESRRHFAQATNILVLTENGNPGSMAIEIDGPISQTRTDNQAPFTLFQADIHPRFPEGEYTITATPYAEQNLQGTIGEPFSTTFTVVDESVILSPSGTVLGKNGEEWIIRDRFESADGFSPELPSNTEFNFVSNYNQNELEYVEFTLTGPSTSITKRDYTMPYQMFNENGEGIFSGISLPEGVYTLALSGKSIDSFRRLFYRPTWEFTVIAFENLTYVPDDNFEQALIDLGYDDVLDDYVLTENINTITELNIDRKNIQVLTGIEDFVALEVFSCIQNQVSTVDLSSLTRLRSLSMAVMEELSTLDVSNNINLEYLDVSSNNLRTIDLSKNLKLREFFCALNIFSQLDVSQNVLLERLNLSYGFLENIDLSNNTLLSMLDLRLNSLTELDLSQNTQLTVLDLQDNSRLTTLNLKNGSNDKLETFEILRCEQLLCIEVDDVAFANGTNWLKDENVSYSTDCSIIDEDNDGVEDSIDICPNTPTGEAVNALGCSLSQLADLAVQNIGLRLGSEPCSDAPNGFAEISVLKNVPIGIQITKDGTDFYNGTIGIETPLSLSELSFGEYQLCVSNDTVLGYEQCFAVSYSSENNSVATSINIQNPGQTYSIAVAGSTSYTMTVNGAASEFAFESTNEQLIEIPLTVGVNTIVITGTLDCTPQSSLTYIPDNNFEQALIDLGLDDVLNNYVLTENISTVLELNLDDKGILDMTGLEDFSALETLSCSFNFRDGNTLNKIDISSNTLLKKFVCAYTDISTLDLSNNTLLETLWVPGSFLENINLSKNVNLKDVILTENNIATLDFTNNPKLEALNVSLASVTFLNISGLSNLTTLNATDNPQLGCIQVSNIADALSQSGWNKDDTASYSVDCSQGADTDGTADKMGAYPTLTNGKVTIANTTEDRIGTISIANMKGQTISVMPIFDNPKEINLDISGHTQGMYIIRVAMMTGKNDYIKVILK